MTINRRTLLVQLGLAGLGPMVLAACQTANVPSGLPMPQPVEGETPDGAALPQARGEVLGRGTVRVALLLPLTGAGGAANAVGTEFRNAAQLAMDDVGSDAIQLVIKNSGEDAAGAQDAASEAVLEASSLVLGPIFSASVAAASAVTRPAGKIMIAFSSDRNVAGSRVYLNSFLPEGVVERIVTHAAANGIRQVVGFFPNGAAGDIAERAARHALQQRGGSLALSVRYDLNEASIAQAAMAAAPALAQAQGVLVPDGGAAPNAIAAMLRSGGADLTGKRFLGTGQWTSSNLADPALAGAWFADSDQQRLATYRNRYRARFGTEPSASSALAYDTVVMVGRIVKRYGAAGIGTSVIEMQSGFAGYTGIFRFESDGTTERGYAIYEVQAGGGTQQVSPAPTSFGTA